MTGGPLRGPVLVPCHGQHVKPIDTLSRFLAQKNGTPTGGDRQGSKSREGQSHTDAVLGEPEPRAEKVNRSTLRSTELVDSQLAGLGPRHFNQYSSLS
jgi:hypothetical protein